MKRCIDCWHNFANDSIQYTSCSGKDIAKQTNVTDFSANVCKVYVRKWWKFWCEK